MKKLIAEIREHDIKIESDADYTELIHVITTLVLSAAEMLRVERDEEGLPNVMAKRLLACIKVVGEVQQEVAENIVDGEMDSNHIQSKISHN